MASVGHIAVGMVAARLQPDSPHRSLAAMAYWSMISVLPDIDFIAFAYGIPYGAPFGHRGATHSFAFAAAVAVISAFFYRGQGRRQAAVVVTTALVVASHPLLDAMTDHGLGCALFWPIDDTRYLLPWRVVPTLPTFESLWSWTAVRIAASECVVFSPLVALALWPGRRRISDARPAQ